MKKYGIISLNIYEKDNNWGSILQSYALQEVILRRGYDVEIVDICPKFINRFEARYPIVRAFPFKFAVFKRSFRNSVLNFWTYVNRDNKFKKFIKNYYRTTPKYTLKDFPVDDFAGFIIGSDIVWNIDFTNGFDDLYFCNLPKMRKLNNISYAPSMCDRSLSEDEKKTFKNRLKNFRYVSVREESQADYIKKEMNSDIEAVIDPTLLLEEKDYSKFLIKGGVVEGGYILVYTVPTDEPLVKYAIECARKKGKKVVLIECLNIQRKSYDYVSYNDAGIEEWLTLVKNADYIFTNSFHACIFSIIFKKQFHVVYRDPGKTKIADLCNSLGIQNFNKKSQRYFFDIDKKIDYNLIYKNLNKLRKRSLEFLTKSLSKGTKYE